MKKKLKPTITVCCSCNFYKHASDIQEELETLGFAVILPSTVPLMKESNDWDVSHYKTWFADEGDYPKKAELILDHFTEVSRGDAILVLNDEKHGVKNYIGGNVLMEMALAFWLKKPIFILGEYPEGSALEEEIKGMLPILLHGDINNLPKSYTAAARK